jgi:hypothetical protein
MGTTSERPTQPSRQPPPQSMTYLQATMLLVLVLVLGVLAIRASFYPVYPRWEYMTRTFVATEARTGEEALHPTTLRIDEAELKLVGADGWEIAGTYLEMETAYPNFGSGEYVTGLQPNVRPQRLVVIFKRQIR